MSKIVRYTHHGTVVNVQEHLIGKHRDHCLCWKHCKRFKPNTGENCAIAQKLYEFDVEQNLTTPVWECPAYVEE